MTDAGPGPASVPAPTIYDILGALRMIVAQLRLYSKSSPQVVKMAGSVCQVIQAWLSEHGELVLATATEGLLVNGKRILGRDSPSAALESSLLLLLQEDRVKSIRFPAGFADDEFLTFLNGLAQKFWDLGDGQAINRRLREEGVSRISVDEIEYLEVGKDDIVLKDGVSKLESAGVTPDELLQGLDSRLEAAAESGKSAELRLRLLRRLLEQDPSLLRQLQSEQSGAGLLEDATGSMTFDQALATIGRLRDILGKCTSEAEEQLRQGVRDLLGTFRGHLALAPSMREALEKAAPEFAQEWPADAEGGTPVEAAPVHRTKMILSFPAALRMEALEREGPGLLKQLVALGRGDLADRVLSQLLESLGETSAPRRRLATDSLLALGPVLESDALGSSRESLEARVRELLDQERDPRVYSRLTELAGQLADSRLRHGQVNEALRLLDVLKRHSVIKDAAFPERARLVLPALDRVTAGEGYKAVAGTLQQSKDASAGLQQAIDRAAIQFLVSQMKEIENLGERLRVGESITKIGETAGAVLCEELQKTTIPTEALRLLEVLPTLVPSGQAEDTLAKLLAEHPVLSVRRRSANLLAERGYPRSVDLLTFAFTTNPVPANRATLAEAVGRLGPHGLELLQTAAESREEPDEVRAAACLALGRTGDARAVPVLLELASKGPKGFTRLFKATSPAVRAAATRGLAAYLAEEGVRKALAALEGDAELAVRSAARLILHPEQVPAARDTRRAVAPSAAPPKGEADSGSLAGTLDSMPLDQVCQMIAGSGKTGLLRISAQGSQGDLYLEKGLVTEVSFQGQEGQAAFNLLFALRQGAYFFRANATAPKPQPPVPIPQMLLEASRVADERSRPPAPA